MMPCPGMKINFRFTTKQYRIKEALQRIEEQLFLMVAPAKMHFPATLIEKAITRYQCLAIQELDGSDVVYVVVDIDVGSEYGTCFCRWMRDDTNGKPFIHADDPVSVLQWFIK